MGIADFLPRASGRVRVCLDDGSLHTGSFRTDILSERAMSVYFYGDVRDISLPIDLIVSVESLADLPLAS
jgi:hypothetical protein